MMLVPTGEPLYEKVPANQFHPPTVLDMLRAQRLTGYARYSFPEAVAVMVYLEGRVAEAVLENGSGSHSGAEVPGRVFDLLAAQAGLIDVYRLSAELATSVRSLLRGQALLKGQALDFLDVKGLLVRLKGEKLTGCLRVYTEDRTALIFYNAGSPIGFFHDGSASIEVTADVSQSIAKLPGAKLDVFTSTDGADPVVTDLIEGLDLRQLWKDAGNRQVQEQARRTRERDEEARRKRAAAQADVARDVRVILLSHLGALGGQLFDKVLADRLARPVLRQDQVGEMLAGLETAAKLLAGASQTRQLVQEVRVRLERATAEAGRG